MVDEYHKLNDKREVAMDRLAEATNKLLELGVNIEQLNSQLPKKDLTIITNAIVEYVNAQKEVNSLR